MSVVANPNRTALNAAFHFVRPGLLAVVFTSAFALSGMANDAGGLREVPLAPQSAKRGATMFAEVTPVSSGVVTQNNYGDPRMWADRYQEFVYGAIGTGVAIGDYDNDGWPDLFVVSKTEGNRLFRNLGGWKFEDVTGKAGVSGRSTSWTETAKNWLGLSDDGGGSSGPWQQGAIFADVNNDGRLDLYVCRFGVPNLLFLNQGDGTFVENAEALGLDVTDASSMAAFADYNRDGRLDVYVQTNLLDAQNDPAGQRDYLFHQNADGTFSNVTDRAGIAGKSQGHSATWWDYNNDGWPDLYIANDFAPADLLYRNNGDGTFTNTLDDVVPHTPHSSMGADLGDVNNDGLIDFLVADMAATTHTKDHRGTAKIRSLLDAHESESSSAPQTMRNALYLNTGTPRVLEAAHLTGLEETDWTWSARFEDLDNDGWLDAHFTNGMVRELHNADLVQRISASESVSDERRVMKASPPFSEANLAYRNLGDLRFEPIGAAWGLDQKNVSFGAAFGDFDRDGDLDLVHTNYEAGVTLLRNDSDTGHRAVVSLRGTESNRFGVGATVRVETSAGVQVRQLVLARGYLSSSEPILHFGLGGSEEIKRLTVTWPNGRNQIFSDLPANRHFTITEPAATTPDERGVATGAAKPRGQFTEVSEAAHFSLASRDERNPALNRQSLLPLRQDRRGPALAVGDLNGDGVEDVLLGGTETDPARIVLAEGPGEIAEGSAASRFAAAVRLSAGGHSTDDGPMLIFDADGNGSADVLLTKADEALPQLLLNNGRAGFTAAPSDVFPLPPMIVGAAAAADFDRDGRLDVFVGARLKPGQYPLSPRSALLRNSGGRFEDITDGMAKGLSEIGMVTSALWSDVDGDGWLDLVVALEWGGVRYWHNNAGRGFDDRSEIAGFSAAGTGWWTSLAAADFNSDGRPDYAVGNVGLNTPYGASATRPALLYHGQFANGRSPLLVEAYHEGETIYPRRTRQDLGATIPTIQRRFSRGDLYASASLNEILGEERVAAATRFAATEFRSGVFLSQVGGLYKFEPLPRLAQIAPLQGLSAGDFDGDGHADIFAVQNSYSPIASVGRFDGGLGQMLRGDGRGHFAAVPIAESNLIVPGDAKALALIDLDRNGWPDFLITRNNSTTLAFRNEGIDGRKSLSVSLQGPAGNPTAIGARVTIELADGSKQMAEVHAGSGYASQSSAALFFGFLESNRPRRVSVRWPTGVVTNHDAATMMASTVTLSAPAVP